MAFFLLDESEFSTEIYDTRFLFITFASPYNLKSSNKKTKSRVLSLFKKI